MKRLFIIVTGMPGSGKSILVDEARKLNLPVYVMGDVVREETLRRHGVITPELMVETSRRLRLEHGDEVVAMRTLEKIKPGEKIIVIDGVRSLREVEVFRQSGEVFIIAIHASPRTRFKRLVERKRPGDPVTYEEFARRDMTELEFGLGDVIALADYVIVNEGSIEDARREASRILRELVKQYGRDNN